MSSQNKQRSTMARVAGSVTLFGFTLMGLSVPVLFICIFTNPWLTFSLVGAFLISGIVLVIAGLIGTKVFIPKHSIRRSEVPIQHMNEHAYVKAIKYYSTHHDWPPCEKNSSDSVVYLVIEKFFEKNRRIPTFLEMDIEYQQYRAETIRRRHLNRKLQQYPIRLDNQQMDSQSEQLARTFMEEGRKAVTPFEMGGYDMNNGNSFNNLP